MELGDRLRNTLHRAGLTPRHFGGAIRVHYVTIYRTINGDGNRQPVHEQIITNALGKVEALVERGDLPFQEKLSRKDKTDRLRVLLETD